MGKILTSPNMSKNIVGKFMIDFFSALEPCPQKATLCTSEAHRVTWWMGLYGSPTPKRHFAYSNSSAIGLLDLGRLRGWAQKQKAMAKAGVDIAKTVVKYIDKNGRERYKGSKALKFTESETHLLETCK